MKRWEERGVKGSTVQRGAHSLGDCHAVGDGVLHPSSMLAPFHSFQPAICPPVYIKLELVHYACKSTVFRAHGTSNASHQFIAEAFYEINNLKIAIIVCFHYHCASSV